MKTIIIFFTFFVFAFSINAMDSRRMAVGEIGTALIGDVGTIEANAAGMAFRKEKEFLHFAVNSQLYSSKLNLGKFYNLNLKALYQSPFFATGVSIKGLKFRNIYSKYNLNLSVAKSFFSQISAGLKVNLLYNAFSINGLNSNYGFDLSPSLLYNSASRFFQIGIVAEKIYTSYKNAEVVLNFGSCFHFLPNLGINLDYQYNLQSFDKLSLGAEALFFKDIITLRGGIIQCQNVYGMGFGVGIQFQNFKLNYAVDMSPTIDVVNSFEFIFGI